MAETATAEATYYSHTLIRRSPLPFMPPSDRDPRLAPITAKLLTLPPEIRQLIYHYAFHGNRVAVTCRSGCYCPSNKTGRYRAEHHWVLELSKAGGKDAAVLKPVRQDAQRGFVAEALWEVHCLSAWQLFEARMRQLRATASVKHVQVTVFETSREGWVVGTGAFQRLRSVTFCPWQKGWTCDVRAQLGSPELGDVAMMPRVRNVLETKSGYDWVWKMVSIGPEGRGGWKVYFLLPVRYLVATSNDRTA